MAPTILAAIMFASTKYPTVPPALIAAVIEVESTFNVNATGKYGEVGLMQVYPKYHTCATYFIRQNVECGTRYLAHLYRRFPQDPEWYLRYNGKKSEGYRRKIKRALKKWEPSFGKIQ